MVHYTNVVLSVMLGCGRKAYTRCWYQAFGFLGHQNYDPNKPLLFIDYHLIYFVIAQRGHLNILTEDMDKSLGVALENLLG